MSGRKEIIYIVSHTHWDRAWYRTFEEFRFRLVELIDFLLDLLRKNPSFKCFALDGQTVVLEDYLEIRPEKRELLIKFIKQKRIMVGPWYILPDEFLVSGEALIRNLMVGHKIAKEMGGVSKAGYVPDPFGHIAQMPQILNGFGIDNFIFTRGMGDEGEELGSEFRWKAMDGNSEVISIWQPKGYGNARALGHKDYNPRFRFNMKLAHETIKNMAEAIRPFSHTPFLLFNNGIDHFYPQKEIPEIIKTWNKSNPDIQLKHDSFDNYIGQIRKYKNKLPEYKGELRGQKYDWILPGVFSSRVYLKIMNHESQMLLERWAEPMAAIAKYHGQPYPESFLWYAWKTLLKNHPHDDICGCSIDEVHEDMVNRFKRTEEVAGTIVQKSMEKITSSIDTMGPDDSIPLVIFNTSGSKLDSVCNLDVDIPVGLKKGYIVLDKNGKLIHSEATFGEEFDVVEEELCTKISSKLSLISDVPEFGYKTVYLKTQDKKELANKNNGDEIYTKYPLLITNKSVENRFYRLTFNKNGTFNIDSKKPNVSMKELGYFEDCEDVGDEYDYSPSSKGKRLTTENAKAKIDLLDSNSLSATYEIRIPWNIPEKITPKRNKRSKNKVNMDIVTKLTVYATIPRLDMETTVDNKAKDHRVRVVFPTSIISKNVLAGDSFCGMPRAVKLPKAENWMAPRPVTHPFRGYLSLPGKFHGFTIMSKGLIEYEILDDDSTMALTLFRSVGWLSRADLLTRSNNAGPSLAAPGGQCLGKMAFNYSIMVHPNLPNLESFLSNAVLQYEGAKGIIADRHKGKNPDSRSLIELDNPDLIISAVKKSERGSGLIVRVYNPGEKICTSKLTTWKTIRKAVPVRLDETAITNKSLKIDKNNSISMEVKPYSILTLKLTL